MILLNQVRGASTTGTFGDWGAAENFTLPQVPPPENVTAGVTDVVQDNDLQVSMEVNVEWISPLLTSGDVKRERRQSDLNTADDATTTYQVLIATEESVGRDYVAAPDGPGIFSRNFQVKMDVEQACCCEMKLDKHIIFEIWYNDKELPAYTIESRLVSQERSKQSKIS